MKKLLYLIVVVLILGLVLTGCSLLSNVGQVPTNEQSGITYLTKHTADDPQVTDLLAGQTIDVGDMKVWNDVNNLYVKYVITASDWCLTETHLHVADELSQIPQTKKGNPILGRFDYKDEYDCVTESYLYTIPLDLDWEPGETLFIATHAVVQKQIDDDSIQEETAWGKGTRFVDKGNWGMYFEYVVEKEVEVTLLQLYSIGDSTAEWTTEEKYSGDYSVKLMMKGGWWDSPNNNAEIQIFIAGNPKISDIDSWSYYLKTACLGDIWKYKPPVELNLDTDGDGEIDKVLYATDATNPTGEWEEWNQDTGHWWYGVGSPDNWAELQSWVSEHYPNATLVRVDLGYGPLGSNREVTAYVDDFTINGTIYELEPNYEL
ncbi:hypothetical protein ES708_17326 [subsurface metagenome]